MSLRILGCVGASVNSGAPIYRVECSECGERYRRAGWPWDIKRRGRCSTCAHEARKKTPGATNWERNGARANAKRRNRAAEMRKCK